MKLEDRWEGLPFRPIVFNKNNREEVKRQIEEGKRLRRKYVRK